MASGRRYRITRRSSATLPTAIRDWRSGAKSTAAVLGKYGHLEAIPPDWRTWGVNASNPGALSRTLAAERDRAFLFRDLATR